jgi:hypothetical protein
MKGAAATKTAQQLLRFHFVFREKSIYVSDSLDLLLRSKKLGCFENKRKCLCFLILSYLFVLYELLHENRTISTTGSNNQQNNSLHHTCMFIISTYRCCTKVFFWVKIKLKENQECVWVLDSFCGEIVSNLRRLEPFAFTVYRLCMCVCL